jgi:HSP20 family molecular chaperone IbpA
MNNNSLKKEKNKNMTTLTTLTPGHFASTERVLRQLPALFNDSWLESAFDKIDRAFDVPGAVYPYNVLTTHNEDNEPVNYVIEVALAGIGKENIDVKVRDGRLNISVNKDDSEKNISYVKKGISQRNGQMAFRLNENININKISSNYKDGLLRVVVPVIQPEIADVDIVVD